MILKVQISLASSDGEQRVLLYNEDRSFEYETPLANVKGLDDKPKAFYEADINMAIHDEIEIVFGKRLPDQGW